jgi:hypothetical protein
MELGLAIVKQFSQIPVIEAGEWAFGITLTFRED